MRVNAEMTGVRARVDRRTLNGETYQRGAGTFLMDGHALSRTTVEGAKVTDQTKYLLCGTCGVLLSFGQVTCCTRCKQLKPRGDYYMAQIAKDWQHRKLGIQESDDTLGMLVHRKNLTDDISTVTSAGESYAQACQQWEQECKLSISERREPSTHRLSAPVDPGFKYRKFLDGFGMQEPWEKVYSQGERLWLPSRANMSRQSHIVHDKVKVETRSDDKQLRHHGPQDKPHHVRSFPGRNLKIDLKR